MHLKASLFAVKESTPHIRAAVLVIEGYCKVMLVLSLMHHEHHWLDFERPSGEQQQIAQVFYLVFVDVVAEGAVVTDLDGNPIYSGLCAALVPVLQKKPINAVVGKPLPLLKGLYAID